MNDGRNISWDIAKAEYENALELSRQYSGFRRQDMAFVTTAQVAILSIIGTKLLSMDLANTLLSIIAFFVLILGINNERRLSAYMTGSIWRANQIEKDYDMSLLRQGRKVVAAKKLLFSNVFVFPIYYLIFIITWIIVWILNLI